MLCIIHVHLPIRSCLKLEAQLIDRLITQSKMAAYISAGGLSNKDTVTRLQQGYINSKFADHVVTCSVSLSTVTPRWPQISLLQHVYCTMTMVHSLYTVFLLTRYNTLQQWLRHLAESSLSPYTKVEKQAS